MVSDQGRVLLAVRSALVNEVGRKPTRALARVVAVYTEALGGAERKSFIEDVFQACFGSGKYKKAARLLVGVGARAEAMTYADNASGRGRYVEAGRVYEGVGEDQKAIEEYTKAGAFDRVADIHMRLGRQKDAADVLMETDCRNYPGLRARAGRIYESLGLKREAAEAFETAGDHGFSDAVRLYMELGMQDRADAVVARTTREIQPGWE